MELEHIAFDLREVAGRRHPRAGPPRRAKGAGAGLPRRGRRAAAAGRAIPAACGRSSSIWSATPSSSPNAAKCVVDVAPGSSDRSDGAAALRRGRHRHRHSGRQAATHLRVLQPGRPFDHAAFRRHRAGTGHFRATGGHDGRPHLGRERSRPGAALFISRPSSAWKRTPPRDWPREPNSATLPVLLVDDNAQCRRVYRRTADAARHAGLRRARRGGRTRGNRPPRRRGLARPPGNHRRGHAGRRRMDARRAAPRRRSPCRLSDHRTGAGQRREESPPNIASSRRCSSSPSRPSIRN